MKVAPGSPGYRAGLRTGDVLGCLSLRDYALLFNGAVGFAAASAPDTVIRTCVSSGASHRIVEFRPISRAPIADWYGSIPLAVLRTCVLLVFLVIGIALVLARPSR